MPAALRPFAFSMPSKIDAQAVVLAGVITSATIEPTPFHLRSTAPLYVQMRRRREPLDLTARVFRYMETFDGAIQPLREVLVRFCRCRV